MERAAKRVLRFLAGGAATMDEAGRGETVLLHAPGGRGTIGVPAALLERLVADGAVERDGLSVRVAAGPEGRGDPLGAARRVVEALPAEDEEGPALVNLAESPLALLARHKAKNGSPFLTAGEFDAGERLRADFTRGSLMPRLGANWIATVASGRRHGGSGVGDLTDAALAARMRVERALDAVGPELAGVLVDVCCFLKGLAQVESERGWPMRSAKVVLKSALGALARHYEPDANRRKAGTVLHWGAAGYRPKVAR